MDAFPSINGVGFSFVRGDELVLGPFAGKPAVPRIARGTGVCGAAWSRTQTLVVGDVPLVRDGMVIGVFDCDGPEPDLVAGDDVRAFEALAAPYAERSERP